MVVDIDGHHVRPVLLVLHEGVVHLVKLLILFEERHEFLIGTVAFYLGAVLNI